MLKKNIRSRVLVPLTLTFFILVGAFLFASYQIRLQDYDTRLSSRYQRVQSVLQSLVVSRTSSMHAIVEFIADQRRFQSAIQNADRQTLLQHGSALLERLQQHQKITHFYFHDADGRNLLRVYQPENRAESTHRFTMATAVARGTVVAGLELGGNGTFTLRLVYPWWVDGQLLGYIELGQEIDPILRELKEVTNIDFLVVIDKAFLERQSWETGMALLGRYADWDLLSDRVLIDKTLDMPQETIAELFSSDALYQVHGAVADIAESEYRSRAFPLRDVAGHVVGDFVLLDDITANIAAFRVFITQIVAFSLFLSSALFIFAYRVLGRVDNQLVESQQRLQQEFDNQRLSTQKLEIEVGERRRAEADLTHLNESLEQRVTERTSELQQLNEELAAGRAALEVAYKELQAKQATILQQDKMACIGQLAAGVAHDINNPVGFVAGNLEILEDFWKKISTYLAVQKKLLHQYPSDGDLTLLAERQKELKVDYVLEELPQVMKECFEGIERVNRIVLNLKGFSRIDDSSALLADIHECLDSTLGIVANELRYKADIIKDYGELPPLYCCPQQLNQVFMNLLINAAQAIERWGEITIKTRAQVEGLTISISDSGCGIAREHQQRIFEPFFTTKGASVGTGLGLSIVYEIVKQHHGEITVSSEPGQGTTFTIFLPFDGLGGTHG